MKVSKPSENLNIKTTELDTCDSTTSTATSELVTEPVVNQSYIEVQPKVWSDAPIIEECESDRDEGTWVRKPTWNNVQRVNKQNQFVPLAVQTRTGNNPVNTVKASGTNYVKEVSTVGEKWDTAVKSSAGCKWRTPGYNNNILSKYNGGSSLRNYSTFKDPLGRLKPKQAWAHDREHSYLADFQDFNGGPVAFGGSKGYITGKGKIKTGKLDFEDVSFVKELQPFNLFSVSQICDKKNKGSRRNTAMPELHNKIRRKEY
ncbi:hypothetical protein Tco_1502588 [Tanacetum coccineum]